MKNLIIVLVLVSSAVVAAKPSQHILIDGSVARCIDMADQGARAFRLKVIAEVAGGLKFQIENLVCINSEDKMVHIPYALSRPFEFKKDGRTLSYEYPMANIVVLNSEATVLFQTIAINPQLSTQEFTVMTKAIPDKIFDMSLQPLEVIKIDGHKMDQGMTFGGSYRIKLGNSF